ncbi:glycosyltransferase [Microcystis aeruginosa CS-1036]|nr:MULTISPECIES: glycosyltransferase [Microcystis]MDB9402950.1 glycosyltransferase [Microcystis sp. CS-574]MDB9541844.1 glycosyltransferase [Microcystis aeruginosa CS-1036]WOB70656.1 glycosyltransferase [Microcystis aeruginosa LE3]
MTVVFNSENYLEQTIQIVINQTYDNVDCIVIDGGSRDGKIDRCKSRLNLSL